MQRNETKPNKVTCLTLVVELKVVALSETFIIRGSLGDKVGISDNELVWTQYYSYFLFPFDPDIMFNTVIHVVCLITQATKVILRKCGFHT